MKVIILAGGRGTRLKHLTENKPKCLLEFQGKSILETQLSLYHRLGIDNIVVIKGHLGHMINFPNITYYIEKEIFNMLNALFFAEPELQGDVVIAYGDIIFQEDILQKLLDDHHDISVVVDMEWKRYFAARLGDPYSDAESLILGKDNKIIEIGASNPPPEKVQSQYIGLIKLTNKGCKIFKDIYHSEKKKYWGKEWIRGKIFEKAYMTDMLQVIIDKGLDVYGVPIQNGWLEFDTVGDYENYLKWEKTGELATFLRL
ncbi:MAG: phosphocholine cytidylyltransferase family protein [Acidobacteria bacterium]|jgi:choline kinase|nr:phosphocholine cytidylyltransferase family protein [Acidobacteriota bacterium]